MIKKILIGSGIALGAVGVITGTVVGVVVSNKKNNTNSQVKPEDNKPNVPTDKPTTPEKPENKPDVPTDKPTTPEKPENKPDVPTDKPENKPNAEQEQAKQAFIKALNVSAFVEPVKLQLPVEVILPTGTTQENVDNAVIEKEIIESLVNTWSGAGTAPNISIVKYNNGGYVVSLDKTSKFIDKYTGLIFGQTWQGIMKQSTNVDFQKINKVDYGFGLVIAQDKKSAQLVPSYIKVSFTQKPSWLKENNFTQTLPNNIDLISEFKLFFK